MTRFSLTIACFFLFLNTHAQNMADKANAFMQSLSDSQRNKIIYPFDIEERYHFVYVPVDDRKGIAVNELNPAQRSLLMNLLNTCLSEEGMKKVNDIMQLEILLKELENRSPEDHYRDPGKYFISIFGIPANNNIWGWRFEGHHLAFNFSANKTQLVATTPNFMGTNPAIVLKGPQKGKEILKDETAKGFALVQALSSNELKKALINTVAPAEIITANNRKAMIEHPEGIGYNELSATNQQLLLQLIKVYVHRYTKLFADNMLKDIHTAGLNKLWFSWAGSTEHALGKPCYYRIQGPTIIIEYDNTQNNANHVHTIVRDLKNDFGGDELLQHYRNGH
jgi:hypothetical protein